MDNGIAQQTARESAQETKYGHRRELVLKRARTFVVPVCCLYQEAVQGVTVQMIWYGMIRNNSVYRRHSVRVLLMGEVIMRGTR